jgi:uncharacterized membrane protein YgcG
MQDFRAVEGCGLSHSVPICIRSALFFLFTCVDLCCVQDFRAVEGCVSAATLQQLGKLQDLVRLDVYGGTGCCRYAGKFEATPQQFAAVLGQMTGLQELGLRGFELLPEPERENGGELEVHSAMNGLSLQDRGEAGVNGAADDGSSSSSSCSVSDGSSGSSGARARQGLATVMQAIANL